MSLYDDGGPGHPSLRPIDYARWFISLRWSSGRP
ncbi:MAG: hypothetical protein KatS3mg042_0807 [Rhodothermaceae bacterium]|nr:MAG: hypothetical protein KatS3mg042_0807 [Rhodothermaceae bacterium]